MNLAPDLKINKIHSELNLHEQRRFDETAQTKWIRVPPSHWCLRRGTTFPAGVVRFNFMSHTSETMSCF